MAKITEVSIENKQKLKELQPKIIRRLKGNNVVFSAPEMVFMRAIYKQTTGRYSNVNCSSCTELYKILNNYLNNTK